ncbi:MAG TPA: hypothetical protein V6C82_06500 [Chroococcales cyanobacterium]
MDDICNGNIGGIAFTNVKEGYYILQIGVFNKCDKELAKEVKYCPTDDCLEVEEARPDGDPLSTYLTVKAPKENNEKDSCCDLNVDITLLTKVQEEDLKDLDKLNVNIKITDPEEGNQFIEGSSCATISCKPEDNGDKGGDCNNNH